MGCRTSARGLLVVRTVTFEPAFSSTPTIRQDGFGSFFCGMDSFTEVMNKGRGQVLVER
jgi:hypothetical protein